MDFINDKEKMKDLFLLTREDFFKKYRNLKEYEYENTLDSMWKDFAYIPVDEDSIYIEEDFHIWEKGTEKEEIWHWFDSRLKEGIGNRYFN